MEYVIQIASYVTAVGVIIKAVDKLLAKKTTPLQQEIKEEIQDINNKIDNNEKDDLRYKILSFANSLHNGNNHTRQEYETIFSFYDKYEAIIKRLKQTNGYLEMEMEFIKETYMQKFGGNI